jgi:hypothetical protein
MDTCQHFRPPLVPILAYSLSSFFFFSFFLFFGILAYSLKVSPYINIYIYIYSNFRQLPNYFSRNSQKRKLIWDKCLFNMISELKVLNSNLDSIIHHLFQLNILRVGPHFLKECLSSQVREC